MGKRKNLIIDVIIIVIIIFLAIVFLWLASTLLLDDGEPHFKITKEGVGVDKIYVGTLQPEGFTGCTVDYWVGEITDEITFDFSQEKCGWIDKKDLTIEWLEENCLGAVSCDLNLENCSYQKNVQSQKYKCGEYFVETWEQIK